jgi:hypothetical protein
MIANPRRSTTPLAAHGRRVKNGDMTRMMAALADEHQLRHRQARCVDLPECQVASRFARFEIAPERLTNLARGAFDESAGQTGDTP